MNIELVKQEIKTLNALIDTWQQGKEVSAIERQVVLNKLTKLYELIALVCHQAESSFAAPIPVAEDPADEQECDESEQEVEVEIIFADEEAEAEIEAGTEVQAEVTQERAEEPAPEIPEIETEPAIEEVPTIEKPAAVEPTETASPEQEVAIKPKEAKPRLTEYQAPMMESLFGAEEIQRRPRSKHQRMMAIYEEAEPKQERQEKVVDISKIFDMEDITPEVIIPEPTSDNHTTPSEPIIPQEKSTLADTIAPTPTLADSIPAPAALAEEMTNSKIDSLHQAIGINDKFLMIRDLFDGDSEAYDKTIAALDKQESLEDCMIYIIENHQWNPDIEGSKFIMQLLERKFS